MSRSNTLFPSAGLLFLALLGGCKLPAQMLWSPDGSAAAYRNGDKGMVIDADGKVMSSLGKSSAFAWSSDSKTLYAALVAELANPVMAPDDRWQSRRPSTTQPAPDPVPDDEKPDPSKFVDLAAWNNGKITSLVKFAGGPVVYLLLSPDQNWLAVVSENHRNSFAVYVYHLPGKRLYLLDDNTRFAMCFTGPNRLAYLEPAGDDGEQMIGQVVEVTLDAKSEQLDRTPLLDVIPDETPWIASIGDNLLLTAVSRSFPGKPTTTDQEPLFKLFMWTRANQGIVAVADDVGLLFAPSPDGSRVLIEKMTPKTEKSEGKRELVLIRANGSDGHVLRALTEPGGFVMWPAWRGNDEIAFITGEAKEVTVGTESRELYDVALYKLTDQGELQSGKTLSESWRAEMKPSPEAPSTTKVAP